MITLFLDSPLHVLNSNSSHIPNFMSTSRLNPNPTHNPNSRFMSTRLLSLRPVWGYHCSPGFPTYPAAPPWTFPTPHQLTFNLPPPQWTFTIAQLLICIYYYLCFHYYQFLLYLYCFISLRPVLMELGAK